MFLWTVIAPAPTTRTVPNEPPPPPDLTPGSAASLNAGRPRQRP